MKSTVWRKYNFITFFMTLLRRRKNLAGDWLIPLQRLTKYERWPPWQDWRLKNMWKVALQFWNDALWVTKKLHLTSGPGITKQTCLRSIIPEELWSAVEFRMSSSVWSRNTAWSWQVAKPLTNTARDLWSLSYISFFFSPVCIKWNRVFCFGNPHASMHIWNQWSL